MTIINLTPHAITEITTGTTFPPSGTVARVSASSTPTGEINGIPLVATTFGEVVGLPPAIVGTRFIVSGLVLDASKRSDLLAPGELVRDANGNPVGCKGFRVATPDPEVETSFPACQVMGILKGPKSAVDKVSVF